MNRDPEHAQGHVWDRMIVGWHLAFWVVVLIAEVYVLSAPDLAGHRSVATGLLAVQAGTYAATVMRDSTRPLRAGSTAYLFVAVLVAGWTCSLDPFLSLLLFVVYPQIWLLSETIFRGVAITVLLTIATIAGFGAYYDWAPDAIRAVVPQMLVSLGFSIALGVWISRVIDQSRERAELLAQLEQTREQLAAAHHSQGVMAERERVAREIHDTLAQGFTSVVMLAQTASGELGRDGSAVAGRLVAIEDVARENLAEARALVAAFSPPGLAGSTLTDALTRLADRFGAESGLAVDLQIAGPVHALGREVEVVLLRAAQEALTNVRRHARARRVVLRLLAAEADARIEVIDDGIGMSPQAGEGFGLAGMRGRVADVGGAVEVSSSPDTGTRVTVRLPALALLAPVVAAG